MMNSSYTTRRPGLFSKISAPRLAPPTREKLLSKVKNPKWCVESFAERQQVQDWSMKVMRRRAKHVAHLKPGLQVPFVIPLF